MTYDMSDFPLAVGDLRRDDYRGRTVRLVQELDRGYCWIVDNVATGRRTRVRRETLRQWPLAFYTVNRPDPVVDPPVEPGTVEIDNGTPITHLGRGLSVSTGTGVLRITESRDGMQGSILIDASEIGYLLRHLRDYGPEDTSDVPVSESTAPAEPAAEAELRTLNVALAQATRAFAAGDLAALGTVNATLQPLVDAAVGYARRQTSWKTPGSLPVRIVNSELRWRCRQCEARYWLRDSAEWHAKRNAGHALVPDPGAEDEHLGPVAAVSGDPR